MNSNIRLRNNMACRTAIQITLVAISFVSLLSPMQAAERKPNVVFILADDLGYRELGCFGQKLIRTPHIDTLAADGMKLTQHYCGNAVCAPSRCVLMTGKHPGHAFIRSNKATPPEGQWPIPKSEVTLPELMKQQGYVTGVFGKWGLGGPDSTGEPLNQGVDRFFGYFCQSHAHSYFPSYLRSDRGRIDLDNKPPIPGHASLAKGADPSDPASYNQFKGTDYAPDRINRQALEFIKANKSRPFLLYYPSVIPHVALHVPDEDLKPYLELAWKDPPFTRDGGYGYTPHFTPRAAYAAMISRLDKYVGNLLKLLDELKLADDTIVIFSSDNGTTHLEKEVDYTFFNSVGELRGLKGSLYEGGVRVPTLVRWPGHVARGSSSDRLSGFEDWMPTILELVGAEKDVPNNIDGVTLAPTLLGQKQADREFLYREFTGYGGQQTIRVGDWKAVRQNLAKGKLEIELYDMANDIREQNNVASDHPEIVARLKALMKREHVASKDFPLKALGDPVPAKKKIQI
jgi:arylsulfatase A